MRCTKLKIDRLLRGAMGLILSQNSLKSPSLDIFCNQLNRDGRYEEEFT